MGNHFHLVANLRFFAGQSRAERVKKRHKPFVSSGRLVLGHKALTLSLLAMVILLGVSYLALINVRVTKGFEIKTLALRLAEAEAIQTQLQLKASELQSIQAIEQKLDTSGFVPITNVSYLQANDYAVGSPAVATP